MPADDLVLNVKQIGGYPPTSSAVATDLVVIQRGGLGGPYLSIDAEALVATALSEGGPFSVQSGVPPSDAFTGQIFCHGLSLFAEGYLASGIYWTGSGWKHYGAILPGGAFGFNPNVGYVLDFAPPGASGAVAPLTRAMTLTPDGAMTLNIGTLTVARDPRGPMEVATARFVAATTVASFNGRTGAVALNLDDILCAGGAPIFSPRFGGQPRALTPPVADNSSRLATTAYVANAIVAAVNQLLEQTFVLSFNGRAGDVTLTGADLAAAGGALTADLAAFAPLLSPSFSGIPTAPTANLGNSSAQLATTAFVQAAVAESTTGVASFNTRTGAVVLTSADVIGAGGAPAASPGLTGVPTAPTAAVGTSTAQIATTAFVLAEIAASTAGVASFNGRTGAVTLSAADITGASGATEAYVNAAVAASVVSFNGRTGAVTLTANDISAAGGSSFLPLTGGSLSGPLNLAGGSGGNVLRGMGVTALASPRWAWLMGDGTAETGSNNGNNLALQAYSDAGALTFTPIQVNRSFGTITLNNGVTAAAALTANSFATFNGGFQWNLNTANVPLYPQLNAAAGSMHRAIQGASGGVGRWNLILGNNAAEIGGNVGSDFFIQGLSDTGALLGNYFTIVRSNGQVTAPVGIVGAAGGAGSNAATGCVGEVVAALQTTAVNLTNSVAANVTSMTLSAGEWDVTGEIWFAFGAAVTVIGAGITTVSAQLPTAPSVSQSRQQFTGTFSGSWILNMRSCRVSVAAATTVYLVALAAFTSTASATGCMYARRSARTG